jgi:hypothetical protein
VWTSNSSSWIELATRCKQEPLVQISSKLKVPGRNSIKFYRILNIENSLNFYLKSISNPPPPLFHRRATHVCATPTPLLSPPPRPFKMVGCHAHAPPPLSSPLCTLASRPPPLCSASSPPSRPCPSAGRRRSRRPEPSPPHCRRASQVSPRPLILARWVAGVAVMLAVQTAWSTGHHHASGSHATAPPPGAVTTSWAHLARAPPTSWPRRRGLKPRLGQATPAWPWAKGGPRLLLRFFFFFRILFSS